MKHNIKVILVIALVIFWAYAGFLFGQDNCRHSRPVQKAQTKCDSEGYTLIEYGVGVTGCGDTIKVEKRKFVVYE